MEPGVAGYRFCFPESGKISDAFIALQERLARLYYYSTKMGNTNALVLCSGQMFLRGIRRPCPEILPGSKRREHFMRKSVLLTLVIAVCLAAGCVGQMKTAAGNIPAVTPSGTFNPFSNDTIDPLLSNISNSTGSSGLKGLLKISTGGLIGEFPVSIDNMSSGVVTPQRPLSLMLDEGNHTVEVCCGVICEEENVTIKFGKQRIVDFSEQLQKDCEFSEPTARITGYFLSGDLLTVNTEFINPSARTLTMSAEISCGYSYIESRSNNRVGNSAQGLVFSTLNAGDRITKTLNLNLASGNSYKYDIPTITRFSSH